MSPKEAGRAGSPSGGCWRESTAPTLPASTGLPSAAKSRVAMPSIPFPAGGPSAAGRGGGTQGLSAWKIRQSCCPGDHAALPTTVGIFPACFVAVMGLGPSFLLALPPTEAQHAMLLSLPQVTYNGAPTSSSGDVCHTCGFRPQQALIPSCREDAEEIFSSTSLQHFPFSRVSWVGVGVCESTNVVQHQHFISEK